VAEWKEGKASKPADRALKAVQKQLDGQARGRKTHGEWSWLT
jgi:hypothetical protein